jgi:hypothetical protein
MRERFDDGGVNREHRVEKVREVNPLRSATKRNNLGPIGRQISH